jgi:hypothetical protein
MVVSWSSRRVLKCSLLVRYTAELPLVIFEKGIIGTHV